MAKFLIFVGYSGLFVSNTAVCTPERMRLSSLSTASRPSCWTVVPILRHWLSGKYRLVVAPDVGFLAAVGIVAAPLVQIRRFNAIGMPAGLSRQHRLSLRQYRVGRRCPVRRGDGPFHPGARCRRMRGTTQPFIPLPGPVLEDVEEDACGQRDRFAASGTVFLIFLRIFARR
ncbi:MAG: hypothetical protein WBP55_02795 [Solirubrobacterales bacterium]